MGKKTFKYRNCLEGRQVELLKEQFEFNEETKTFDIVLHFAKASDIFNERLDLLKKRVMKDEVIEEVASMLNDIPRGYKADLSLVIDDYEDIPYQEILDAFNNVLRNRFIRLKRDSRRKYYKVGIIVTIGAFLISLMILGEIMQWWGGETIQGRLISYLIDTAGCVCIWEGLYSALLERTTDAALGYVLATRLSSIGLYRNDGSDQALLSERNGEVVVIEKDRLGLRAGSMLLYLSGFFLLGAGVFGFMLRAPLMASIVSTGGEAAIILIALFELISSFFLCGLGFLAIAMFNENYRYFIFTSIAAVLILGLVIGSFVSLFTGQSSPASIISSVVSLIAMTFFVVGFVLTTYYRRRDIKKTLHKGK